MERQGQSAIVWLDRGKKPDGEFLAGKHRIMLDLGSTHSLTPRQWGQMRRFATMHWPVAAMLLVTTCAEEHGKSRASLNS